MDGVFTDDGSVNIKAVRQELGLTQAEFARLTGFSVRAVQSCEQGWRRPGVALEKTVLLLLIAHRKGGTVPELRCWEVMSCPQARREHCITYQSDQGHLCWYLRGTPCTGPAAQEWDEKRPQCIDCPLFELLLSRPAEEAT